MTAYCTTCGGRPHADGEELAGAPGHKMTWGRLAPLEARAKVEALPTPPNGPTAIREGMPDDAPRNALWLLTVPTRKTHVIESWGFWKGTEVHILGVAGVSTDGVRFLSQWKMTPKGWASDGHHLIGAGHFGKVTWKTVKEVLEDGVGGE